MKRRNFLEKTAVASALFGLGIPKINATNFVESSSNIGDTFKLNYAPHLGMFEKHAGKDPVDQLNFMADMGFRAFEDNGMKGRSVAIQEAMAHTMEDRKMTMGVFVAHKIYWKEANLAG